jgi:hypothetical protein
MPDHTIHIHVDHDGNFTYTPAAQHAKDDEAINWRCDDGSFTVSFVDHTPFEKVDFHGPKGQNSPDPPEGFRDGVEPGVYHYLVDVAREVRDEKGLSSTKVFLNGGCPEIIIET